MLSYTREALLRLGKRSRAIRNQEEAVILRLFFESCEVWSGGRGVRLQLDFCQKEASFVFEESVSGLMSSDEHRF